MLNFPAPTQDQSKRALERFLNAAVGLLASNNIPESEELFR